MRNPCDIENNGHSYYSLAGGGHTFAVEMFVFRVFAVLLVWK